MLYSGLGDRVSESLVSKSNQTKQNEQNYCIYIKECTSHTQAFVSFSDLLDGILLNFNFFNRVIYNACIFETVFFNFIFKQTDSNWFLNMNALFC